MSLQAIPSDTFYQGKGKKRTIEKPDSVEEEEVEEQQIDLDRVCSFVDLAPLPKKERPTGPVRMKTFPEYWMTGDTMLKIVEMKRKSSQKAEDKKSREKNLHENSIDQVQADRKKEKCKESPPKENQIKSSFVNRLDLDLDLYRLK